MESLWIDTGIISFSSELYISASDICIIVP